MKEVRNGKVEVSGVQDEKRETKRKRKRMEKEADLDGGNDVGYFSAMRQVEERMWSKWGALRTDRESREVQSVMSRILDGLGLMYQVRFVSLYMMYLMKNSWDKVIPRMNRSFASKSSGYRNNALIVSCIFISSNYEELEPPSYVRLVNAVSDSGFGMEPGEKILRRHVHALERVAWGLTEFQVELPSANSFLMQIIQNSELPKARKFRVSRLSREIIHNSLNTKAIIEHRQSLIAISSIVLAISIEYETLPDKKKFYTNKALGYSGYNARQVFKVQEILRKTALESP